jgi:hypothetical protein
MRVFNIAASKRVCSVKESGASLRTNNSRARGLFREILELRLNHGVDLRAAAHAMRASGTDLLYAPMLIPSENFFR